MKNISDQLDFNFSRPIDIQRNVKLEILDDCINILIKENENELFKKHLRLLIIELYFCWEESESQFLAVSMSKRGYNSRSRYNPNRISSYMIKIINFLFKEKFIELYPGFYDARSKKSRLTRIRPSKLLIYYFKKVKLEKKINFNHKFREYIFISQGGIFREYTDTYETQEIRATMKYYNTLISKTLFDIPLQEEKFLMRGDNRKIIISKFLSYNYVYDSINRRIICDGCWWNKLDLYSLLKIQQKLSINHKSTSYINLLDIFGYYLTEISKVNITMKPNFSSKIFNYDQLCYFILKISRSKNYGGFIKSVINEKKKICLEDYSNKEIRDSIDQYIINNPKLSSFFYKNTDIGWEGFMSKFFIFLLNELISLNIPIYLVRDKIYFPSDFKSVVMSKVEKILSKLLNINTVNIECKKSFTIDIEKKGFFGRLITPEIRFSRRYIENKNYFGID